MCLRFLDAVASLPPHSVLGVSLLLDEPLDLGPKRLQVLLLKRVKSVRLKQHLAAFFNYISTEK